MSWVYVIKSEKGRYYIGSTVNLESRFKRHNKGTACVTTKGSKWSIVFCREYSTLEEARGEEKRIKSFKGGNAFKKLMNGDVTKA